MSHTALGRFATPSFDEFGKPVLAGHDQFGYHVYVSADDAGDSQANALVFVDATGVRVLTSTSCQCSINVVAVSDSSAMVNSEACMAALGHATVFSSRLRHFDGQGVVSVTASAYGESLVTLAALVCVNTCAVSSYVAFSIGLVVVVSHTLAMPIAIVSAYIDLLVVSCNAASVKVRVRHGLVDICIAALVSSDSIVVKGAAGGLSLLSHVDSISNYATGAIAFLFSCVDLSGIGSYIVRFDLPVSTVCVYCYGDSVRICAGVPYQSMFIPAPLVDAESTRIKDVAGDAVCSIDTVASSSYVVDHIGQLAGAVRLDSCADAVFGGFGGACVEIHTRGEPIIILLAFPSELKACVSTDSNAIHVFLSSANISVSLVPMAGGTRYRCGYASLSLALQFDTVSHTILSLVCDVCASSSVFAGLAKPIEIESFHALIAVVTCADGEIFVPQSRPGAGYTHLGRCMCQALSEYGYLLGLGCDQFGYLTYVMPYRETLVRLVGADAVPSIITCQADVESHRIFYASGNATVTWLLGAAADAEYWPVATVCISGSATADSVRIYEDIVECDIVVATSATSAKIIAAGIQLVICKIDTAAYGMRLVDAGLLVVAACVVAGSDMDGLKCASATVMASCSALVSSVAFYVGTGWIESVVIVSSAAIRCVEMTLEPVCAVLIAEACSTRVLFGDICGVSAHTDVLAGSSSSCYIEPCHMLGRAILTARVVRPVTSDIRPMTVRAHASAMSEHYRVGYSAISARGFIDAYSNVNWSPTLWLYIRAYSRLLGGLVCLLDANFLGCALWHSAIVRLIDVKPAKLHIVGSTASSASRSLILGTNVIGKADTSVAFCSYDFMLEASMTARASCELSLTSGMLGVPAPVNAHAYSEAMPTRCVVLASSYSIGSASLACAFPFCEMVGRALVDAVVLVCDWSWHAAIQCSASLQAHIGSGVRFSARLTGRALLQTSIVESSLAIKFAEDEQTWHVDKDLDWRPDIQYPYRPASGVAPDIEDEPEEEYDEKPPYLQPFATSVLAALNNALRTIDEALGIAENILEDVVIVVDPEEDPATTDAIRHFILADGAPVKIDYRTMERCAAEMADNPVADAVVSAWVKHMAISSKQYATAGEVAPILVDMRGQVVDTIELGADYIADEAAGYVVPVRDNGTIDSQHLQKLRGAEEARLNHISEHVASGIEFIRSKDWDAYYTARGEYTELVEGRRSLYDIASSMEIQATNADRAANTSIMLMKSQPYDVFGDGLTDFACRVVGDLSGLSADYSAAQIEETRQCLNKAQALMALWQRHSVDTYMNARRASYGSKVGISSKMRAALYRQIRRQVINPVVVWLDDLYQPVEKVIDDPLHLDEMRSAFVDPCAPMEYIGAMLLGQVADMLQKCNDMIAEQLRATISMSSIADRLLDSIRGRDGVRKTMTLFDDMASLLNMAQGYLANATEDMLSGAPIEFTNIAHDFLLHRGYDCSFDLETRTMRNIESFLKKVGESAIQSLLS